MNSTINDPRAEDMSLSQAVSTLWSRRRLVIGFAMLVGIVALVVALIIPKQYEATILLAPVADENEGGRLGGLSSLVSQYGGLSALGGLNLASSNRKAEAVATLQSRALTMTFIREKNLLPVLFPTRWDAERGQWKTSDPEKIPTLLQGEEYFIKKIMQLTENKKTGLIEVSITWTNGQQASDWANELVVRTNQYLRQRATEQSSRNIDYLNNQLSKSSVVELQKAIYQLIEAEIKKTMIAQGSDEYAFKIVDPAVTPEKKIKPQRSLIVLIGIFVGGAIGALWALIVGPRKAT